MQWGILFYLLYKHPNTPGDFLLQIVAIAEESGGSIGHAHMGFSRETNSLVFHSASHQYPFFHQGFSIAGIQGYCFDERTHGGGTIHGMLVVFTGPLRTIIDLGDWGFQN